MDQTNDQPTPETEAAFIAYFGPKVGADLLAMLRAAQNAEATLQRQRRSLSAAQGPAIEFTAQRATNEAIDHARASSRGYSIHRPRDTQ